MRSCQKFYLSLQACPLTRARPFCPLILSRFEGMALASRARLLTQRLTRQVLRLRLPEGWRVLKTLINSDGSGNLHIFDPSRSTNIGVVLEEVVNLYNPKKTESFKDLFSDVTCKGVQSSRQNGKKSKYSPVVGTAKDLEISRYRPKLIKVDGMTTAQEIKDRAEWEIYFRRAKSINFTCQIAGWDIDGTVLMPGYSIQVVSEKMRLDQEMLIQSVNFKLDSGSKTTDITLVDVDSYAGGAAEN